MKHLVSNTVILVINPVLANILDGIISQHHLCRHISGSDTPSEINEIRSEQHRIQNLITLSNTINVTDSVP